MYSISTLWETWSMFCPIPADCLPREVDLTAFGRRHGPSRTHINLNFDFKQTERISDTDFGNWPLVNRCNLNKGQGCHFLSNRFDHEANSQLLRQSSTKLRNCPKSTITFPSSLRPDGSLIDWAAPRKISGAAFDNYCHCWFIRPIIFSFNYFVNNMGEKKWSVIFPHRQTWYIQNSLFYSTITLKTQRHSVQRKAKKTSAHLRSSDIFKDQSSCY